MMASHLVAALLFISVAAAQHVDSSITRSEQPDNHVILTSRGEAAIQKHKHKSHAGDDDDDDDDDDAATSGDGDDGDAAPKETSSHDSTQFAQLVNGSTPTGYMQLGTPPKWILVIFDTGSDLLVAKTWDTVSAELDSIDQGVAGMVLPSDLIYNHNSSSTYKAKFMKDPTTGKQVKAKSQISYGSGMAITDEGNDTVKVGNFFLDNFSLSEVTADSLQLLHDSKGISGVLGLQHMKNRSAGKSLFSRARDEGKLTAFGYCRGTGDNGTFFWGDKSTEGKAIEVVGQIHWAVKLGNVTTTGGNQTAKPKEKAESHDQIVARVTPEKRAADNEDDMDFDPKRDGLRIARQGKDADHAEDDLAGMACGNHSCIGILDTGSNIIAGPTSVMKDIASKASVSPDCSNFDSLPTITFSFGGEQVSVEPKGYVMKIPMPKWMPGQGGGGYGDGDGDGPGGGDGDGDGGGGMGGDGDAGGGMGGGGFSQYPSADLREGGSLDQQQARRSGGRSKLGWKAVLEHLHKHRGIDLSAAVGDIDLDFKNKSDTPQFLCMPALVPLDKMTKFGKLYVVGTPLLQTHYARWSWAKDEDSPKIFIKKLSEADTCKNVKADTLDSTPTGSLEANVPPSASLMRSEQKGSSSYFENSKREAELSSGPFIRELDEISYPHWALNVEDI